MAESGAAALARLSQERFVDGSGYPRGLAGEQITIGGRIRRAEGSRIARKTLTFIDDQHSA